MTSGRYVVATSPASLRRLAAAMSTIHHLRMRTVCRILAALPDGPVRPVAVRIPDAEARRACPLRN